MKHTSPVRPGDAGFAARLRREVEGDVLFDAASRGRYATDASIYQIDPVGVVVPRSENDVAAAIAIAREAGVAVLPRGGGTSQCGQTVGEALVVDVSRHLDRVLEVDREGQRVRVQPGVVLDDLNVSLRPDGLFFPVDVSTANRATLGGMAGNNSCGSRSVRYGNMVHNVLGIDAILSDGEKVSFGEVGGNLEGIAAGRRYHEIVERLRALGAREADEIEARFPKLLRRVGGYNIDSIDPAGHNMAHMLVGSEGTLGFFTELDLKLAPLSAHRVLGVCHFETFYAAMQAPQHIAALDPAAVELVDRTLMDLAWDIEMFRPTLETFIRGRPEALLLVEFAGEELAPLVSALDRLETMLADHGNPDAVIKIVEPSAQAAVWDVRKQGLNIVMSMKGDGKPVSFVEDCSVRLADLPEYTRRLTEIFGKHGTRGTWYAHASVGTLHVRPILNMKTDEGPKAMRAIAEECFEMVREYEGSHSGEHGDGLVRSEFHEPMFGKRLVDAFGEVKEIFDPGHVFNPGKIVDPERMDDRELMRFKPGFEQIPVHNVLDWDEWGGLHGAVEMCNNNGACRKHVGVMCPSYRATRDEVHLTRGRANTLRLALSGQLEPASDPLANEAVREAMDLCVSCKACRRECPTGVDMARMKIEYLAANHRTRGATLTDRLVAHLPRYAPLASRLAGLLNLRNALRPLRKLSETAGFSAKRELPRWRSDAIRDVEAPADPDSVDVALFIDTFTRWFEPELVTASERVLHAMGLRTTRLAYGDRPLCCGRTYLATGMVDQAREEAARVRRALIPYARRGIPIVGLEPSCVLSFRDEYTALFDDGDVGPIAEHSMLIDEFIARESDRLPSSLAATGCVSVHGHCHQKAFGAFDATLTALGRIDGLTVTPIESSCCGMAGNFGYTPEHYDVSMQMGELALFPAVRDAADARIVAAGTSCRHQIRHGTGRDAVHPVQVLADALDGT